VSQASLIKFFRCNSEIEIFRFSEIKKSGLITTLSLAEPSRSNYSIPFVDYALINEQADSNAASRLKIGPMAGDQLATGPRTTNFYPNIYIDIPLVSTISRSTHGNYRMKNMGLDGKCLQSH